MSTCTPLLRIFALQPGELVVDNFAGGGGASTGIEAAIGRPVDLAVNHDPEAIAMHQANHPETRHFCESIWDVDPREACGSRPVGLAWFSPDCFPASTMVLTDRGYVAIEHVRAGDVVLTHRQRWRKVTWTHQIAKPLREIRGHGHYGLRVSDEHPFYARQRHALHRGYSFDAPAWVPAAQLERGWYWATPMAVPELPIPQLVGSAKGTTLPVDARLLWLAGRYVGDGWTRLTPTRAELVIICGKHEAETLKPRLNMWPRTGVRVRDGELAWCQREVRTAVQFTANSRALVEWLRGNFGHGAGEKTVPAWLLGAPVGLARAFLEGYLSADGHAHDDAKGKPMVEATTVSPALAWGLRTLLSTLGVAAAVYRGANRNTIEGRTVNTRPVYSVRWRCSIEANHAQTFVEDGLRWSPIRDAHGLEGEHEVYNLAVEEDESYVAEGIIVHNCTHFSRAKGSQPRDQGIRGLAWVVIRWAREVAPRVIILENVEEFQTWGPLLEDCRPDPAHQGETFRDWLGQLTGLGYTVEFRSIVAADYGAPTTRRRLFLVARRDGFTPAWPAPTHGKGTAEHWHSAAECIDWSLPCPSIFDRPRPLAEATLRRIAAGIRKYVIEAAEPFVIRTDMHKSHAGCAFPMQDPLRTITSTGGFALVSPTLIQMGYGEREGQAPRVPGRPLGTVTGIDHHALTAAFLTKFYGTAVGADAREPMPTVTSGGGKGGGHLAEVRAFLIKYYGADGRPQTEDLFTPLHTVTSRARFGLGLVLMDGEPFQIVDIGMRMLQPHELFAAQGFPGTYKIDPEFRGQPLTKTAQIKLAGNSVCPPVAQALVEANTQE